MEETVNDNSELKKKLIRSILKKMKKKEMKYYKRFKKMRKINRCLKSVINGLNALSVCSLILMFSPISPVFLIIALSSTSLSGVSNAVISASDLERRITTDQTSYLQYADLYRSIDNMLLVNHLSSTDLDNELKTINEKLGLIEDSSNAI